MPYSHHVFLQLLGFFKGMSFPIASIAVVNSVLFGVYSNTLLALTATSHQERWAQPPSYTHVFIAGCTGGFVQVRGRHGGMCTQVLSSTQTAVSMHTYTCTHMRTGAPCRLQAFLRVHEELWGNGQLLAAPSDLAWLSCGLLGCRSGGECHREQRGQEAERAGGRMGGDGAKRTPWSRVDAPC